MTVGRSMNAMIRMLQRQRGHTSASTSYPCLTMRAHARFAVEADTGSAAGGERRGAVRYVVRNVP